MEVKVSLALLEGHLTSAFREHGVDSITALAAALVPKPKSLVSRNPPGIDEILKRMEEAFREYERYNDPDSPRAPVPTDKELSL